MSNAETLRAADLDLNATIWKTGTLAECESFRDNGDPRTGNRFPGGVIARFRDGAYCYASKPSRMR
jgi:hypothetical protein